MNRQQFIKYRKYRNLIESIIFNDNNDLSEPIFDKDTILKTIVDDELNDPTNKIKDTLFFEYIDDNGDFQDSRECANFHICVFVENRKLGICPSDAEQYSHINEFPCISIYVDGNIEKTAFGKLCKLLEKYKIQLLNDVKFEICMSNTTISFAARKKTFAGNIILENCMIYNHYNNPAHINIYTDINKSHFHLLDFSEKTAYNQNGDVIFHQL